MTEIDNVRKLLLISNSTVFGAGYLDHAETEIKDFLPKVSRIVFVPFALHERGGYVAKAQARLSEMGFSLTSIHDVSNMVRTIEEADAIFVGGGNTFRLLKGLQDHNLEGPIRKRIAVGIPYIGSSAGSIVACPSLKTTKDMPVVQPPSFEALGLVPFQISPHYLDPDPTSKHMGETQEERIMQFLEENEEPVIGLREGSLLRIEGGAVTLKGPNTARIFRRGEEPCEEKPGADLSSVLLEPARLAGARA
jgi:dipeptidase E